MNNSFKVLFLVFCLVVLGYLGYQQAPNIATSVDMLLQSTQPVTTRINPAEDLPWPHEPVSQIMMTKALPFEPPASSWFATEKSRYREILSKQHFDYLVVPFQVQDHALDASARTIMTGMLAHRLGQRTESSVANPDYVRRALGQPLRRFSEREVFDLASEISAQKIIWAYVGHDLIQGMNITVGVQEPDSRGIYSSADEVSFVTRAGMRFSHEELPFEQFGKVLDSVLDGLPLKLVAGPKRVIVGNDQSLSIPEDAVALDQLKHESAVQQAHLLQWLGVLYPFDSANQMEEELFARSLVMLSDVSPESSDYHLLKARALFYLHRRPAAVGALSKPKNKRRNRFPSFYGRRFKSVGECGE